LGDSSYLYVRPTFGDDDLRHPRIAKYVILGGNETPLCAEHMGAFGVECQRGIVSNSTPCVTVEDLRAIDAMRCYHPHRSEGVDPNGYVKCDKQSMYMCRSCVPAYFGYRDEECIDMICETAYKHIKKHYIRLYNDVRYVPIQTYKNKLGEVMKQYAAHIKKERISKNTRDTDVLTRLNG